MLNLFTLAVFIGAALGIYEYNRRRLRKRIAAATSLATAHGFRVDVGPKSPPPQEFDLFDVGSSKQVWFHFWRPGEQDSVFDYRYTTGSGKNRQVHHHTCALISLPFAAAHTKIGPEGFWSGVGRAIGLRDIEVESPEFNSRYRVTGDDERFAVTLLDQPMIAWLLSERSGGGRVRFELWGPWLLCVSDRLDIEQHFGFLDWAQSIRSHLPAVLSSLYPVR